ncbi:MAG: succinate--CoA ligase subunit alpha [Thermoleophilia bacterium]|nr:succinate--CoA ligase subunit alpha [Thermoleophilia bacterium]
MSILVNAETQVLVQNIRGREGRFHTRRMLDYGTRIVAGTAAGHGGEVIEGVPVFDTVREAVKETRVDASIVFVPAANACDALYEAIDNNIKLVVCITEGIPVLDMTRVVAYAQVKGCRIVGPNCPGIIVPGECKLGIMPTSAFRPGSVGIVSRSGTLTYEVAAQLSNRGIGQSTCVGIGGDPILGMSFVDVLELFEQDPATDLIVLIGEIGGSAEQEAAAFIGRGVTKPVVAFIAGKTAPRDKRMGHAGAIISGGEGTAQEKIRALEAAGVTTANTPEELAEIVANLRS